MKIYVFIFLAISFGSIWCGYTPKHIISVKQGEDIGGIWKSNTKWKAHWVKEWHVKKKSRQVVRTKSMDYKSIMDVADLCPSVAKGVGSCGRQGMDSYSKSATTLDSVAPSLNSAILGRITVYNCTLYALLSTLNK